MYFLLCCEETRKIKSFGDFHMRNLILKAVLYIVLDMSFCLNFLICHFAVLLVALALKKKKKYKSKVECYTLPKRKNKEDAWTNCGPTCRFLDFCEAPQKPRNLLFYSLSLGVFSWCDWQACCFLSLRAQEATRIVLECSLHRFLLSDLNRIFSSLKSGLLCSTFTAFQVFLEIIECPPKNWISWSVFSLGGNFKA